MDDCVREKRVNVRRDTMEEVLETENGKLLHPNELRSVILVCRWQYDGTLNESGRLALRGCVLGLAAAWRGATRVRTGPRRNSPFWVRDLAA